MNEFFLNMFKIYTNDILENTDKIVEEFEGINDVSSQILKKWMQNEII